MQLIRTRIVTVFETTGPKVARTVSGPMAQIEIVPVDGSNITCLESINTAVLPLQYSSRFYEAVAEQKSGCWLAYFDGSPAGAVCTALDDQGSVYIQTLTVLPGFQRQGIGSALMNLIISAAEALKLTVAAHVWINNYTAIQFYAKFGFQFYRIQENYYRKLIPAAAWYAIKTSGTALSRE